MTSEMAAAASLTFSHDFEREADYVALYVLGRADRPIAGAAVLWRRVAHEFS